MRYTKCQLGKMLKDDIIRIVFDNWNEIDRLKAEAEKEPVDICKNCKHWWKEAKCCRHPDMLYAKIAHVAVVANDYCSRFEKNEEVVSDESEA